MFWDSVSILAFWKISMWAIWLSLTAAQLILMRYRFHGNTVTIQSLVRWDMYRHWNRDVFWKVILIFSVYVRSLQCQGLVRIERFGSLGYLCNYMIPFQIKDAQHWHDLHEGYWLVKLHTGDTSHDKAWSIHSLKTLRFESIYWIQKWAFICCGSF